MKKTFCLLCFLHIYSVSAYAQRQKLDSLHAIRLKYQATTNYEADTAYLNLLHKVAYAYSSTKPDSMLIVAQKLKQLSEKHHYPKGVSRALQDIGLYYYGMGNYSKAIDNIFQALRIAEKIKHSQSISSCYNNIAIIYHDQNMLDKAIEYHLKALEVKQKAQDTKSMASTFGNIGAIYSDKKDSKKALEYFFKALKIDEQQGDIEGITSSYASIGGEYLILKNIKEATFYLEKALKLAQNSGDNDLESEVMCYLAQCEIQNKNFDSALDWAEKALKIGYQLQKKANIQNALEIKSEALEAKGNFQESLKNHKLFKIYYDSLLNLENLNKTQQIQLQYETEKKEAVLEAKQQKETAEKRLYTILIIIAFIFAIALITVLYISQRRALNANHIISEQKAEIESQNAELEAQADHLRDINTLKDKLFSIMGHDLKVPLNQISGILPILEMGGMTPQEFKHISVGIKQSLTHASNLLENLFKWALSQLGGETIKPQAFDLQEIVQNNIELYTPIAEKKKIKIISSTKDVVQVWADKDMIDLVVRNLLSNSLKFCTFDDVISFEIIKDNQFVVLSITDTGIGIPTDAFPTLFGEGHASVLGTEGEKGTGLGLTLCRDFIQKNGGKIWAQSEVGKGSTFYFTVPQFIDFSETA